MILVITRQLNLWMVYIISYEAKNEKNVLFYAVVLKSALRYLGQVYK